MVVVGFLLVKYREQTMTWLTVAIGVLFLVSGLVSCAAYFAARRNPVEVDVFDSDGKLVRGRANPFPLAGLGSFVLGLVLTFMPGTFIDWLMYILAAMLLIGSVSQFIALAYAAKTSRVGLFFWVMPSLIFLVSLVALVKPSAVASAPLFVIGWCLMLYGVFEIIILLNIRGAASKVS